MNVFHIDQALRGKEVAEEVVIKERRHSREVNSPQQQTPGEKLAGQTLVNKIQITTSAHS